MRLVRVIVCAATALAGTMVAIPTQAESLVRWVTTFNPSGFDPSTSDDPQTLAVQRQVYEPLVCYDSALRARPCLAVSWKQSDPLTWEFALRQGVTFHDGAPFTSADVVFSLERARADTSVLAPQLAEIERIVATDAHTVRITTRTPDLILWDNLSFIPILGRNWAEAHDAQRPAPAEALATRHANMHANGTGAFMLESFEAGRRIVLVRNPIWWGREQQPQSIDRLERLQVTTPEVGIGMLLRGEADFTQEIPPGRLEEVRHAPGVRVKEAEAAQALYLGFDLASPELRTASVKGRNPFQDKRVREAIYRGIDFERLKAAVGGLARPAGMIVGRTAAGYDEELDRPLPYDPARARALLAEAGYPDGFSVALDTSRFYLPLSEAIPPMLADIGITVELRIHPTSELDGLIRTRGTDFYRWGHSEDLDSTYVFRNRYDSRAEHNIGYGDPEVDRLVDAIEAEVSTYPRLGMIERVWRKVLDAVVYVPLSRVVNAWAMRDRLDVPMGTDSSYPRFQESTVKPGEVR